MDTARPPLRPELYDPTAPPAPRTRLLGSRGATLRTHHRASRVRLQRLDTDGHPVGEAVTTDTATWVTVGEPLDTAPSPGVDLRLPTREVSVELELRSWAYWLFLDPGLPGRVWARR